MAIISIEGMEFYSYHGHYEEEQIIGNNFVLDLWFTVDTTKAQQQDVLENTVNYQSVYAIVKQEMGVNSKLIEHVAWRILKRSKDEFPLIESCWIKICKMNPPIGGQTEMVCVELHSDEL